MVRGERTGQSQIPAAKREAEAPVTHSRLRKNRPHLLDWSWVSRGANQVRRTEKETTFLPWRHLLGKGPTVSATVSTRAADSCGRN